MFKKWRSFYLFILYSGMDSEYESDFESETASTRTTPTKSITLPYAGSTHHCFTRSYGFLSSRTNSTASSVNPGQKYLRSSFPDLLENLGENTKLRKSKLYDNDETDNRRSREKKKLSFGEEIKKRNERQWLRIEDVARNTMERYDDYCKNLVTKNEIQHREIQDKNRKQIHQLKQIEIKKKKDHINQSSYARIWNHHAYMRELGERMYQEKMARKQARQAKLNEKTMQRHRHWENYQKVT